MNAEMIVLRLLHIGLGVVWAGAIFFFVLFLEPAVRAAGPDGAKVMKGIQQRHYMTILPVIAGLTLLTGLVLFMRLSAGRAAGWAASPVGMGYSIGGLAAIIAFFIGVFVMRRSALRAGRLSTDMQTAEGDARTALQARVQALQGRARTSAHWVAVLLAFSVGAMAIARYL
ncbi:MAG: hypothetical protein O7I93_17670 [Gemmatimonadetes bacterium]|nr:hypothetical protein [Gemmatimonadota bacterium]